MGDVRTATYIQERIFFERAENIIMAKYENQIDQMSWDDYKAFAKTKLEEIHELQSQLMYEAGLE